MYIVQVSCIKCILYTYAYRTRIACSMLNANVFEYNIQVENLVTTDNEEEQAFLKLTHDWFSRDVNCN